MCPKAFVETPYYLYPKCSNSPTPRVLELLESFSCVKYHVNIPQVQVRWHLQHQRKLNGTPGIALVIWPVVRSTTK